MIVLGVSTKNMPNYKAPADLKGKKISVTAPGSSTSMLVNFFLAKHGLKSVGRLLHRRGRGRRRGHRAAHAARSMPSPTSTR